MSPYRARRKPPRTAHMPPNALRTIEIAFIFFVFVFVLAILYPKGQLQDKVLAEKSNYTLTATYLENMLRTDPENTKLLLAATDIAIERGRNDLARYLLEIFRKHPRPRFAPKIALLRYRLQTSTESNATLREKRARDWIDRVASTRRFDAKTARLWFDEAIAHKRPEAAAIFFDALWPTLRTHTTFTDATKRLLDTAWTLFASLHRYDKAAAVLDLLARHDPSYLPRSASMFAAAGMYDKAAARYIRLAKKAPHDTRKRRYLLEAMRNYASAGEKTRAVALAKAYLPLFLRRDESAETLIRFLLSIGEVSQARAVALELLEGKK